MIIAKNSLCPFNGVGTNSLLLVEFEVYKIFLREYFSINIKNRKIINNILASCLAVVKSFSPNQVLKIPDVKVGIAKCSTAPKSDRTSIATNIRDATIEGLAIGNATLKKVLNLDRPRVRDTSKISLD